MLRNDLPIRTVIGAMIIRRNGLTYLIRANVVREDLLRFTNARVTVDRLIVGEGVENNARLRIAVLLRTSVACVGR